MEESDEMKNKEEIKQELEKFCFEYSYRDEEVEVVPLGDERYLHERSF